MIHYVDLLYWEHDIRKKFYFNAIFNTWMNVHVDAGQSCLLLIVTMSLVVFSLHRY